MGKRYYWLKLKEDFFSSKRIKKLRRLAGGDTYTIIYLKIQLKAMKTDGILEFDHLENSFAEELALDIDEEPDNVQVTLNYLLSCGLAEASDKDAFFFPYSIENTGSETSSAQRVRECRARKAAAALPEGNAECNAESNASALPNATNALQCNGDALHCNNSVTERKREEIEKDIDIEIEGEKEGSGGKENQPAAVLTLGPYRNVVLTPSDYEKLKNSFLYCDDGIKRLSLDIAQNGDNGTPHYNRLLEWLTIRAMQAGSGKQPEPKKNRDMNFEDQRQAAIKKLQEGK